MDQSENLSRSHDISTKVTLTLQKRVKLAQECCNERVQERFMTSIA